MFNTGRICVKIAGRDAGKTCVIINKIDDTFVIIDGETRRRKCNIKHLEPLDKTLKLNKDASRDEIKAIFKAKLSIELKDTKPKKATERVKKQHVKKVTPVKEKKVVKKKVAKKVVAKKSNASVAEEKKVAEEKSAKPVVTKESKE